MNSVTDPTNHVPPCTLLSRGHSTTVFSQATVIRVKLRSSFGDHIMLQSSVKLTAKPVLESILISAQGPRRRLSEKPPKPSMLMIIQ